MSRPVNRTVIGLFVISATALITAAVLILGSGSLFSPREKLVMFFEGSVKGLDVGAPVIFRGVKVGAVKEIQLLFNPRDWSALIPVYIEINPRAFAVSKGGPSEASGTEYVSVETLIERGLTAQLQIQSFVTGQLLLNLDLQPDKKEKLAGLDRRYPEIPTLPTSLEELEKTLQDMELPELARKVMHTIDGIEKFVNSPDLGESLSGLKKTIKDLDRLVNNLDDRTAPMAASLHETSEAAQGALRNIEKAFSPNDGLPVRLGETLKNADASLQKAEQTLAAIQAAVQDNAGLGDELTMALRELGATARSLRFLSDYLERHPEALLRGKGATKGE